MLNTNEQIAILSDAITSGSLYAQLGTPVTPIAPNFFDFSAVDAKYATVAINPELWKNFNNIRFILEYDSSEVEFKTVKLDGSGSASVSTSVTEAGGVGRASVQMSATGGKGFVLYFKPLDSNTYSDVLIKNYVLNGVSSSLSLSAIEGNFLSTPIKDPVIMDKSYLLDVIVDAGVLGVNALLLKGLSEKITYKDGVIVNHTVTYKDTVFDYNAIDSLITTVVRNGAFTEEFSQEIADYHPPVAGISYQNAIEMVGLPNIDAIILTVAGGDGLFAR